MTIENPTAHKEAMIPVLKRTATQLLQNLKPLTKSKLLEGQTLNELLNLCVEKYSEEFDTCFPSLGLAGANEVAWSEALGDFNDAVWEESTD